MTNTNNQHKIIKSNQSEKDDLKEGMSCNQENMEAIMEEILELLNLDISYKKQISEIENIMNELDSNYPILNLTLASTTLNYKQKNFIITPKGLQNSKRDAIDGIVLFGYERKNKINNSNTDRLYSDLKSEDKNDIEESEDFLFNDFVFPIEERENNNGLYELPTFVIYFNTKDKNYYIKDFNNGVGALMKIKKYKIEGNTLINIGSNYLVVNLEKNKVIIKIFNHTILENNNTKENTGKNCDTKEFNIEKNKNKFISIGRSEKCDIIISDDMLSKVHTCIEYKYKDKSFYLYDGDKKKESTNGTWVFIRNPIKITDNFMFKAEHTLFVANITSNK